MIESKWGQRVAGLLLFLVGAGFTAWCWYTALTEGYYYRKAVAIFPAFAVIGLGLLVFPIDVEQIRAEHGVDKPSKFAHYPLEWKLLFFVALAAALVNWIAIANL
jgi:hypothetical protein